MPEFGATTELHGRVDGSLRVGAALDGPAVPAWISATLSGLYEADFLDVRIVALDVASLDSSRPRASRWPAVLFTLYEKLDYRLFKSVTDAFAHVDVIEALTGRANVLTDLADDSTLAAVRSEELDVVLWFASTRPRAELLDCARFGVWTLNLDEAPTCPSGPSFARVRASLVVIQRPDAKTGAVQKLRSRSCRREPEHDVQLLRAYGRKRRVVGQIRENIRSPSQGLDHIDVREGVCC